MSLIEDLVNEGIVGRGDLRVLSSALAAFSTVLDRSTLDSVLDTIVTYAYEVKAMTPDQLDEEKDRLSDSKEAPRARGSS